MTQTREPKGGLATLVVLLIMVGIVAVGFVAQNAVAGEPPRPVSVARGVSVQPLVGWEFASQRFDASFSPASAA